jgi:hypothetical protein
VTTNCLEIGDPDISAVIAELRVWDHVGFWDRRGNFYSESAWQLWVERERKRPLMARRAAVA